MDELIVRVSKIPLTQRILIVAAAVVLLLIFSYLLFIGPKQKEVKILTARAESLETKLVAKNAIARNLSRYRVEVERLKQRLNEALTLLPNEAEIPELLQKVAGLVEQSDCRMETFQPQPEVSANFYARIPVKMMIIGNYHSIAVFFDKVSKLARIVNVTDISFKQPKIQNKKVILKAEFLATTFKFVERKGDDPKTSSGFKK